MCFRPSLTGVFVLSAVMSACITDHVPVNLYVSGDAAIDAGSMTSSEPSTDAPAVDSGAPMSMDATFMAGADNGPCDLTGAWLITQHGIYQALSVTQTSMTWYYYELEQSGSDLRVKKGLACGAHVVHQSPLGADIEWPDAWPATTMKVSHTGRRGTVSSNGGSCGVSFEIAYTVLGATAPYYADVNHDLPTLDQKAVGDTPGWEDWDNDGNPGVSFHVGNIAQGVRYSVQRTYNDWTNGAYAPGAKVIKLKSPPQTDESILGATNDFIKTVAAGVNDDSGYTQLAKLNPGQVTGDDLTICETVRTLAPMLLPEANAP